MKIRWSHCVLKVRDFDTMLAFYCEAFGWRVADQGEVAPGIRIAFLSGSSTDHHQIGLLEMADDGEGKNVDHNAFRVESIGDVMEMHARMSTDDRVSRVAPVTHGNAVSVYFSDPEGNGIEIFCDTPWHVEQPVIAGWDPTMSADEVLADIEERFKDSPGFMPMTQYRSQQAARFGEAQ
ncbi:MAG: VOC family protein [Actinomycetota bacterium]